MQGATELRSADRVVEQAIDARARLVRENAWRSLPESWVTSQTAGDNRIVTINRSDPAHVAFDMIRTKVLQSLRQNGWTSVAITSPTPNCGKSLVALNLAFSLSHQKDCRTVLMDMDLQAPSIDELLDMHGAPSLEAFFRGDCDPKDILRRYEENLAIGANKWSTRHSSEILQSQETARVLKEMRQTLSPDVILFDLPSMLSRDDVTAFLPNVDCAILVVEAERSTFHEVDLCERELAERTNVLGVVLNKCRL
jgi:Mrp family chromosome partitioning ATPase